MATFLCLGEGMVKQRPVAIAHAGRERVSGTREEQLEKLPLRLGPGKDAGEGNPKREQVAVQVRDLQPRSHSYGRKRNGWELMDDGMYDRSLDG